MTSYIPLLYLSICVFKTKVPCGHHIFGFYFILKIYSAILCLLIREFNQFLFKVIINSEELTFAILLMVFWLFCRSTTPCFLYHCPFYVLMSFGITVLWLLDHFLVCDCCKLSLCGYYEGEPFVNCSILLQGEAESFQNYGSLFLLSLPLVYLYPHAFC